MSIITLKLKEIDLYASEHKSFLIPSKITYVTLFLLNTDRVIHNKLKVHLTKNIQNFLIPGSSDQEYIQPYPN